MVIPAPACLGGHSVKTPREEVGNALEERPAKVRCGWKSTSQRLWSLIAPLSCLEAQSPRSFPELGTK